MKPKILAIITTYNRPEICGRLLDSLDLVTSNEFDVFLIENKSEKDYSKIVSKEHRFKITHKKMEDNYGLPITYNIAIRHAIKNDYDYIWILDDDTVVDKDVLKYMVEELQTNTDVAVTGSAIYNIDKRTKLLHAGAFFNFNLFAPKNNKVTEKVSDVDYVADCSSLARVSMIKKNNIFYDESYFLHIEDIDFPLLFKEKGYRVTVNPRSKIYHLDWFVNYLDKSYLLYYDTRNMLYLLMKFRPSEFKKTGFVRMNTHKGTTSFLIASIFWYLSGNIPNAKAFYYAVDDFYNCSMGRSDFYNRSDIEMLKNKGKIRNKRILVPLKLFEQENDQLTRLLKEHTETCEIVYAPTLSDNRQVIRSLFSSKKFDYVFSSNRLMRILHPLLGKNIMKIENNNIFVYSLNYLDFIRFAVRAINLGIKITITRIFKFDKWKKRLMWEPSSGPSRS
jgi:GT2 family glycosyltransferase